MATICTSRTLTSHQTQPNSSFSARNITQASNTTICGISINLVRRIYIDKNVRGIQMNNQLFPNVEEIVSDNDTYKNTGAGMLMRITGKNTGTLINTFCKKPGEPLQLLGDRSCIDGHVLHHVQCHGSQADPGSGHHLV